MNFVFTREGVIHQGRPVGGTSRSVLLACSGRQELGYDLGDFDFPTELPCRCGGPGIARRCKRCHA